MGRLLRDMLDLTYLESGRLPLRVEPVEMVRLVAETIAALSMPDAPHRITLRAPRALMLRGDGARIEQIVRHLLENAIKFSPGGGGIQVTLSTRRAVDGEGDEVAWCVLRVRDRGVGVPAGLEETIFAPFAQPETAATRWISGIGLGLPLSRALARQHGGTLHALPGRRTGATFELCLPLAGPGHLASDSAPAGR
jgi:signal transduction histidine kinase